MNNEKLPSPGCATNSRMENPHINNVFRTSRRVFYHWTYQVFNSGFVMLRFRKKITKTIVSAFVLVSFTFAYGVRPANAAVPIILGGYFAADALSTWIAASFFVHCAGFGAYKWWISKGTNSKIVNAKGDIGRPGAVVWVDLDKVGSPTAKIADATARVGHSDLLDKVKQNPDKYPNLKDALTKDNLVKKQDDPRFNKSGSVYQSTNGRLFTGSWHLGSDWGLYSTNDTSIVWTGNYYKAMQCSGTVKQGGKTYYRCRVWCCTSFSSASRPQNEDRTPEEFASEVSGNSSDFPADVYSDRYGNEIDDFLKSNPNVIHWEDGPLDNVGNNPPFRIPSSASRSDVDAAGGGGTSPGGGSGHNGGYGSPGYPSSPFPSTADDDGNGNPDGDNDGDGIPDDSNGDGLPDNPGENEEDDSGSFSPPRSHDPYGTDEFDFGSRADQFISSVKSSALFGLPDAIGGIPSGGTSSMTVDCGRFGTHAVDFAAYETIWATIRSIMLIVFGVCAIRIVTLKGGGG